MPDELVPYTRGSEPYAADWLLDPAEIANRIGGTDFVPVAIRNNPAAITAALLYGAEAGLGRMQSLAKIAVINGRPTMAAEAMRALILRAGHDLWVDELTITRCTMAGRRRDSDAISRVTWTMDDAKRAGLATKQAWRMYPRQMLLARASVPGRDRRPGRDRGARGRTRTGANRRWDGKGADDTPAPSRYRDDGRNDRPFGSDAAADNGEPLSTAVDGDGRADLPPDDSAAGGGRPGSQDLTWPGAGAGPPARRTGGRRSARA
jgi:hypothetical protein